MPIVECKDCTEIYCKACTDQLKTLEGDKKECSSCLKKFTERRINRTYFNIMQKKLKFMHLCQP